MSETKTNEDSKQFNALLKRMLSTPPKPHKKPEKPSKTESTKKTAE
jgi:hypothetical protein